MATNLVRFDLNGTPRWGVVSGSSISPLAGDYPTTAALIEHGKTDWRAAQKQAATLSLDSIKILAPVTTPARIYCQGANYRQHMIESGMDPDGKLFNMFFTKSDASIASARERVKRPKHVELLDYEIELALIFRRAVEGPVGVTRETLKDYVFAIAVGNDLSARDVQLPQTQFFKGKSYRGFCPLGPWLTVLEDDEFDRLGDLELELTVNGAMRQRELDPKSCFQTRRDSLRAVHFREHRAGRRAADRNARRLRAACPAAGRSPHRPAAPRSPILDTVPQVTKPAAAVPPAGRSDQGAHLQRRRSPGPWRAADRNRSGSMTPKKRLPPVPSCWRCHAAHLRRSGKETRIGRTESMTFAKGRVDRGLGRRSLA